MWKRILSCVIAFTAFCATSEEIWVRETPENPFPDGKILENVWKKADVVTGFVVPREAKAATFQTEGALLFDRTNLYIRLKGYFEPSLRTAGKKQSLFKSNNFEIFLQARPETKEFIQVAVSEDGKIYTGGSSGERALEGLRCFTVTGKKSWEACLTIPLVALNLKVPNAGEKKRLRFNFCRFNVDTGNGNEPEASSFAVLDQYSYNLPDTWREALIGSSSLPASVHCGKSATIPVNLLPNSSFQYAVKNHPLYWHGDATTFRQETEPLSKVWFLRADGRHYQTLTVSVNLVPDAMYTLRVRARYFGEEKQAFGMIQMVRKADGKIGEGAISAWNIPLTSSFQEYFIVFKALKNLDHLAFYRIGGKEKTSGVDFASVALFEGKISPFEVRKIVRSGLKQVVPGTEVLPQAFPSFEKNNNKIRALAIIDSLSRVQELMEIFSGTGVQYDFLTVTGKNQDVYYTDGDPGKIKENLEHGLYNLYMIGARNVTEKVGPELSARIIRNVEVGAGLLFPSGAPKGNFTKLFEKYPPREVSAGHYLKQALPLKMFRLPAEAGDPLTGICEADAGKGRVVLTGSAYPGDQFKIRQHSEDYASAFFPYSAFADAWLARLVYYTAGQSDRRIENVREQNGQWIVSGKNLPDNSQIRWKVFDKTGGKVATDAVRIRNGQATIPVCVPEMSGFFVLVLQAETSPGNIDDWYCQVFRKEGPEIIGFHDLRKYYSGKDAGQFHFQVKGDPKDLTLKWMLEDFSGRILEKGTEKATAEMNLTVPMKMLYTNLGRLTLALVRNGKTVDRQRFAIYVQDRDLLRLRNDFTPCVWNAGSTSMESGEIIAHQLEKIGFRSHLLPLQGAALPLNNGMGVGGPYLAGDLFAAPSGQNNVRHPNFNTPDAYRRISASVERNTQIGRHFGYVHTAVCDEPYLGSNSQDEFDAAPENVAEYRRRIKLRYGTIEAFNRCAGTSFRNFDDLCAITASEARKEKRFAEFIEWRNFNTDRWSEIIRVISDAAKKGDPNSVLSLYNTFGEGIFSGNDYWKLLTRTGLDFSHEYTSMVYMGNNPMYDFDEFYRSFRPDMRVWGFIGYNNGAERLLFQPWWFALHRYGGFTWFGATADVGPGGGTFWLNILDVPTNAFTQDAHDLRNSLEKSKLMDGIGKLFLEYGWSKPDVAVYYSHDSMMVSFLLGQETRNGEILAAGPLYEYFQSRHNLRYLLEYLLYQYNFLSKEQVLSEGLKPYKVLFMPGIVSMSNAEVLAVKNFLSCGGTVVADFPPGLYDELGQKRAEAPLKKEKNTIILGKIFDEQNSGQRRQIFTHLRKAGAKPAVSCENAWDFTGREAMHFEKDGLHVFAVLHNPLRGGEEPETTFHFPVRGYVYDLRTGQYYGQTDSVHCRIPDAEAVLFGVYPYRIISVDLKAPGEVSAGSDLSAEFSVRTEENMKPGCHVFHVEVIQPDGKCRFHMKRNLSAPNGKIPFVFRMAFNDPKGIWKLRVTDVLSGQTKEKEFKLK